MVSVKRCCDVNMIIRDLKIPARPAYINRPQQFLYKGVSCMFQVKGRGEWRRLD